MIDGQALFNFIGFLTLDLDSLLIQFFIQFVLVVIRLQLDIFQQTFYGSRCDDSHIERFAHTFVLNFHISHFVKLSFFFLDVFQHFLFFGFPRE